MFPLQCIKLILCGVIKKIGSQIINLHQLLNVARRYLKFPFKFIVQVTLKKISRVRGIVLFKMSLTNYSNFLVADWISMLNLTLFVDRFVTDGNYESVLFIYDDDDVHIKDTNFIPQLSDLSFGKYAMFIMKENYSEWGTSPKLPPHQEHSRLLQVLTLKDVDKFRMRKLSLRYGFSKNQQNVVLLISMPPDDRKMDIWRIFRKFNSRLRFVNMIVVFYQTEVSMALANSSRESIEIFALNYKYGIRGSIAVDVENSVYKGHLNDSNLHDKVFASIIKKTDLTINTISAVNVSVTKTNVQRENVCVSLYNLGSADFYLSNFIARNLRSKDVIFEQLLEHRKMRVSQLEANKYFYSVSNEKTYAELYNLPTKQRRFQKFVFTIIEEKTSD